MPKHNYLRYPINIAVGTIKQLAIDAHTNAIIHGFWEEFKGISNHVTALAKLALITEEVGEAVSAVREGDTEWLAEELADIVIRVFDLAECNNIDIQSEIFSKMQYNVNRPYKHGKLV